MSFNIPFRVGDTLGRDHQYWPTLTREQWVALTYPGGDPTNPTIINQTDEAYPIGVDLKTIMAMTWLVREWTIPAAAFSGVVNIVDGPIPSPGEVGIETITGATLQITCRTQVAPDPTTDGQLRDCRHELDIVGPWANAPLPGDYTTTLTPTPIFKTSRNHGIDPLGSINAVLATGNAALYSGYYQNSDMVANSVVSDSVPPFFPGLFLSYTNSEFVKTGTVSMFRDYILYDADTQLFYPPIAAGFGAAGTNIDGRGDRVTAFGIGCRVLPVTRHVPPVSGFPDVVVGHFTIGGMYGLSDLVLPLGYFGGRPYTPDEIAAGMIVPTVSFGFDMTATQFWPYQNTLGQAIYDATTGAPTGNDPFA
jgi:hypothetical protein